VPAATAQEPLRLTITDPNVQPLPFAIPTFEAELPGSEEMAQQYLEAGDVAWNSGMFVFPAARFLDAVGYYTPDAEPGLRRIGKAWWTDERDDVLDTVYPDQPEISVDEGVMKPASRDDRVQVCTTVIDVRWLDVGSWTSFAETLEADTRQNRANVQTVHVDSAGVLVVSDDPNHTIATVGCRDLIIVHTPDATLVCSWDEAQKVKDLAGMVNERLR